MTTENLAVLFSDVVGSTELSLAMSPEAADEVRRGYFSVLRQAVAATGGNEVKGLGDGIMVTFGLRFRRAGLLRRHAARRRVGQSRPHLQRGTADRAEWR